MATNSPSTRDLMLTVANASTLPISCNWLGTVLATALAIKTGDGGRAIAVVFSPFEHPSIMSSATMASASNAAPEFLRQLCCSALQIGSPAWVIIDLGLYNGRDINLLV